MRAAKEGAGSDAMEGFWKGRWLLVAFWKGMGLGVAFLQYRLAARAVGIFCGFSLRSFWQLQLRTGIHVLFLPLRSYLQFFIPLIFNGRKVQIHLSSSVRAQEI